MSTFKEKMRSIVNASKHAAIERFAIVMTVMILACIALTCWVVAANIKADHERWTNQVVYSGSFTSSETGTKGSVVSVSANADRTKAVVLLKVEDMSRLTSNVGNYGVAVSGGYADNDYVHAIDVDVHGGVYLFGNTGYIAVYLEGNKPFPPDVYHIMLRVARESSIRNEYVFDDMDVKINLAADGVGHISSLDANEVDITNYLCESWLDHNDNESRDLLYNDLMQMRETLILAEEYTDKLREYDVDVDAMVPAFVRGDTIDITEDGTVLLSTDTYADNTINIDATGGNVRDGYFVTTGSDMSLDAYISSVGTKALYDDSLASDAWRYTNGVPVEETDDATMLKVIDNLVATWEEYMEIKGRFQVTDRLPFLENEKLYRSLTENVTSHIGDNVVWVW